jgi:alanyl-tRNA synthetase
VLLSDTPPLSIVVARASDVSVDAAGLLKALIARFGGKGGGRPEMAQGGGLSAQAADVLAAAREAVGG